MVVFSMFFLNFIFFLQYYYSIKDISIGGMCVCNGHAKSCPANSSAGVSNNNLTNALLKDRQVYCVFSLQDFSCNCEHYTAGLNCEVCAPGFNQHKWQPGNNGFKCEGISEYINI